MRGVCSNVDKGGTAASIRVTMPINTHSTWLGCGWMIPPETACRTAEPGYIGKYNAFSTKREDYKSAQETLKPKIMIR